MIYSKARFKTIFLFTFNGYYAKETVSKGMVFFVFVINEHCSELQIFLMYSSFISCQLKQ
jgi:hypothetical protein